MEVIDYKLNNDLLMQSSQNVAFINTKENKDDFILLKKASTLRNTEEVDKVEFKEEDDEQALLSNIKK